MSEEQYSARSIPWQLTPTCVAGKRQRFKLCSDHDVGGQTRPPGSKYGCRAPNMASEIIYFSPQQSVFPLPCRWEGSKRRRNGRPGPAIHIRYQPTPKKRPKWPTVDLWNRGLKWEVAEGSIWHIGNCCRDRPLKNIYAPVTALVLASSIPPSLSLSLRPSPRGTEKLPLFLGSPATDSS